MALLRENCQMICVPNLEISDWRLCLKGISCHWMFNPLCWTKSKKPKRQIRKLKRLRKRLAREKPKDSMKMNKVLYGMGNVSVFHKKEIAEHIALYDVCSRVKAEHQKPAGLLQPLPIPDWKWDKIGMDFITGLPRTRSRYDSILVVVDRLTKVAHFIPVKTTYTSAKLAKIYMSRIVCLHGVPKSIVSDRGTQFTSHFWRQLHESLGTRLEFSTASHPQTDGQTERTNQILEDMLRACAL